VVRFGGDEFIALLANASPSVGADVAERIRTLVANQVYHVSDGVEVTATVSVGHATMQPKLGMTTPEGLLEAADKNLYVAKSTGRNCVEGRSAAC
jgi:diguanylate cyclase (GGDEF)-like protein